MHALDYRRSYPTFEGAYGYEVSDPFWYTEEVGLLNNDKTAVLTVDSAVSDFARAKTAMGEHYETRSRADDRSGSWHTTHTAVYDIEHKTVAVFSSSENEVEYDFNFKEYYTAAEIDALLSALKSSLEANSNE